MDWLKNTRLLDAFAHDVRFSVRHLRRNPGFALTAVCVLALGLAASTAVFTYVNAYDQLFPGVGAKRVYQVYVQTEDDPWSAISYADYLDYAAAELPSARAVVADRGGYGASVRHETLTEVVFGQAVSGEYFDAFEVELRLGRGFGAEDNAPNAEPTVILGHDYWIRRFDSRMVLGETLYLNNNPYTIIGVAGRDFLGTDAGRRPDIWLPMRQYIIVYWAGSDRETNREGADVDVYVRLRDGRTVQQLQAELDGVAAGLDETYPLVRGSRSLLALPATWIHPSARTAETSTNNVLLMASGLLLILACANVANLLLATSTGRRQEMAMRAAQGATPLRLFHQLLIENAMLGLAAGTIAYLAADPIASRIGTYFARPSVWGTFVPRATHVDGRVFFFALGVSLLAGLAAGLLPALQGSRRNLVEVLKTSGTNPRPPARLGRWRIPGLRDALVSAQVGVSLVLLVVSALVLRTLGAVGQVDPGFEVENLVASYLTTSSIGTPPDERPQFFRELAEHLETLPWVSAVTVAAQAPLSSHPVTELRVGDQERPVSLTVARVVPDYFETLGIDLLEGRHFELSDDESSPPVVAVNQTLAARYFPGGSAVGREIWWPAADGAGEERYEIVGIVSDARVLSFMEEPEPVVYLAYPQHYYTPANAVLLLTTIDPEAAVPLFEQELRAVNPRIALVNALPYRDVVRGFMYVQRMNAELFSVMAILGLALAAVGLFGVLSLSVGQRVKEIGVRVALGADRRDVTSLVMGRALGSVGLGLVLGLVLTAQMSPVARTLLIGVEPNDPVAIAAGVLCILVTALVAAYLPTRRAVRIDPATSLRVE